MQNLTLYLLFLLTILMVTYYIQYLAITLFLLYAGFIIIDQRPENGGQPINSKIGSSVWDYFSCYFPYKLVIENEEAFKDEPFIFGYHPHGIISTGAIMTFASTKFEEKVRNVKARLLTLSAQFNIPFYREFLMALGICSVSKKSIHNLLDKGESCVIVVGGAEEALMTNKGGIQLNIQSRKGFIKIALQKGVKLVPIFCFGENELFDQIDVENGSLLYSLQRNVKCWTGFSLPLFYGKGVIFKSGLLPKKSPLCVVVGAPIPVTQINDPSTEQISELHYRYTKELRSLYYRNKDKFGADSKHKELIFV